MLSICIPHFNFENPLLFKELEEQCLNLNIKFEIIIADDASEKQFTNYLKDFDQREHFNIIYLNQNIGRSRIRNFLVENSKYDLLLFLDGDSGIVSTDFIKTYLDKISDFDMLSGGRIYVSLKNNNYKLHWLYGTKTESLADHNFHSNNFIIRKKVFTDVKFDESLSLYGYEDAVFGVMFNLKGFKYKKIENPVIHLQLKDNKQFLEDTASAIKNICHLKNNKPELISHLNLPLLKLQQRLQKLGLTKLIGISEDFILKVLYQKLLENKALFPLLNLKIYKLYLLNKLLKDGYK